MDLSQRTDLKGVEIEVVSKKLKRVRLIKDADFETAEDCLKVFWGCHYGQTQKLMGLFRQLEKEGSLEQEVKAHRSSAEGNGGFWDGVVSTDYLAPYWKALEDRTGCKPFSMSFPSVTGINARSACLAAESDPADGKLYARVIIEVFPLVNHCFDEVPAGTSMHLQSKFENEAVSQAVRTIDADLGTIQGTPEFIAVGNGLFRPNPDYPGRGCNKIDPGAASDLVWGDIWQAWLEQHASKGQKYMWEKIRECMPFSKRLAVRGPALHSGWRGVEHYDGYNKTISWEDFKNL